jgi:hypothetical protein
MHKHFCATGGIQHIVCVSVSRFRLSDIIHEILGVKELLLTTQPLVICLIKRSFDATLHKAYRSCLNDASGASSGRLNKHRLINSLQGISDETRCRLDGSQICLTTIFSRLLSLSHDGVVGYVILGLSLALYSLDGETKAHLYYDVCCFYLMKVCGLLRNFHVYLTKRQKII